MEPNLPPGTAMVVISVTAFLGSAANREPSGERSQYGSGAAKRTSPILRGLSARAPFFHNGSAQTLLDVVHFYETRFGLVLTPQEESDLVAFLSAL